LFEHGIGVQNDAERGRICKHAAGMVSCSRGGR
jgi:hypothetical protein